jgi:hypothetical protein
LPTTYTQRPRACTYYISFDSASFICGGGGSKLKPKSAETSAESATFSCHCQPSAAKFILSQNPSKIFKYAKPRRYLPGVYRAERAGHHHRLLLGRSERGMKITLLINSQMFPNRFPKVKKPHFPL